MRISFTEAYSSLTAGQLKKLLNGVPEDSPVEFTVSCESGGYDHIGEIVTADNDENKLKLYLYPGDQPEGKW